MEGPFRRRNPRGAYGASSVSMAFFVDRFSADASVFPSTNLGLARSFTPLSAGGFRQELLRDRTQFLEMFAQIRQQAAALLSSTDARRRIQLNWFGY